MDHREEQHQEQEDEEKEEEAAVGEMQEVAVILRLYHRVVEDITPINLL